MPVIPHKLLKLKPQEFSVKDFENIPDLKGIYGIIDEALGLEYLGIINNLRNRFTNPDTGLFDHHYYHRHCALPATLFGLSDCFVFETYLCVCTISDSWENIKQLERGLIRKYHPRGNKRHNPFASTSFWQLCNIIDLMRKDDDYSLWEKEYWNPFFRLYMTESRKMKKYNIKRYLQDSWLFNYNPFKEFVLEAQRK